MIDSERQQTAKSGHEVDPVAVCLSRAKLLCLDSPETIRTSLLSMAERNGTLLNRTFQVPLVRRRGRASSIVRHVGNVWFQRPRAEFASSPEDVFDLEAGYRGRSTDFILMIHLDQANLLTRIVARRRHRQRQPNSSLRQLCSSRLQRSITPSHFYDSVVHFIDNHTILHSVPDSSQGFVGFESLLP